MIMTRKCSAFITPPIIRTIIYSLVLSHTKDCPIIWSSAPKSGTSGVAVAKKAPLVAIKLKYHLSRYIWSHNKSCCQPQQKQIIILHFYRSPVLWNSLLDEIVSTAKTTDNFYKKKKNLTTNYGFNEQSIKFCMKTSVVSGADRGSHLFQSAPQVFVSVLVERIQVLPHCVGEQHWVLRTRGSSGYTPITWQNINLYWHQPPAKLALDKLLHSTTRGQQMRRNWARQRLIINLNWCAHSLVAPDLRLTAK